jgi:hypothetical protein
MNNNIHSINSYLLDHDFYDSTSLFRMHWPELPSKLHLRGVDGEKAAVLLEKNFAAKIIQSLQYVSVRASAKKDEMEVRHYILDGKLVLEFGYEYCLIFYGAGGDAALRDQLRAAFMKLKKRGKAAPQEINLILETEKGLRLRCMEVKRTKLDIGLYYNDDFRPVDELICRQLRMKQSKGVVLLHGIPGTGKTSYLRYLIGKMKKQVLFIPPELAGRIADPELVHLLADNPDSILVIEDAEHILMQRQAGNGSPVAGLLNISDGLLSDFLNVQLICTFNSALSTVDEALLRKGRLIARYEFGRLSIAKAQQLSRHLGFSTTITRPMTLAEVSNQDQLTQPEPARRLIGFSRQLAEV